VIAIVLALLAAQEPARAPNDFFAGGTPTFVRGTAGADAVDHAIEIQARKIRDLLFPAAELQADVDVRRDAWPPRPILYGGPHVHALLAELGDDLPFRLERGRLAIGGRTFEGDDVRLIALVPAGAAHPELLLYAGTGACGVAEINACTHGSEPILVFDRFGRLCTGNWTRGPQGELAAELSAAAPRIEWRALERPAARLLRPADLPAASTDEALADAASQAVLDTAKLLGIDAPRPIDVYVHASPRAKAALTGKRGNGHSDVEARAIHVEPFDTDRMASLLRHEACHVLVQDAFGGAGTAALGEGIAVWTAGQYAGESLKDWKSRLHEPPTLAELLGRSFFQLPERASYPAAGLFVQAAVDELGVARVAQNLLPASASTWAAACRAAGVDADVLERRFRAGLAPGAR
jgi:hypothetical protein